MDIHEKNESTSANSEKGRVPKCGRCRIHGVKVDIKGHKNYCKYQNCDCEDCCQFVLKQRLSANKTAITRALDPKKKRKILSEEVARPPLFLIRRRRCNLHILLDYTLREMSMSYTVWHTPLKLWYIFDILTKYAEDLDAGIKFDARLEYAKSCIFQVIYENPMSLMTFQQSACCYLSPLRASDEEPPVGIRSLQYPFQNLPITLPKSATNTSPFPESSLKSPESTESSTKTFIDPSTESSTEPSTEPSTYYW